MTKLKSVIKEKLPAATIRNSVNRLPKIDIKGVWRNVTKETIIPFLQTQNIEFKDEVIRVMRDVEVGGGKTFTIKISPEAFRRIRNISTLGVEWRECYWEENPKQEWRRC